VSEVPRTLTERRMMDEGKDREDRQLAEQQWRELPAVARELVREAMGRAIAENPELLSAP